MSDTLFGTALWVAFGVVGLAAFRRPLGLPATHFVWLVFAVLGPVGFVALAAFATLDVLTAQRRQ